jgi:hypothetical protein
MPSKRLNDNFQIASLRLFPESYMMEPEGGETTMKDKRYIRMNPEEMRLAVNAMIWFRNTAIQKGIDTIDIDRLLVKLYKARKA